MKKIITLAGGLLLVVCCVMCRKANPSALSDASLFDPRLSGGMATFFAARSLLNRSNSLPSSSRPTCFKNFAFVNRLNFISPVPF